MPAPCTKSPNITLFSINPETGEPYMSVKQAEALITYHIHRFAPFLLNSNEMPDLVQTVLLQMCINEYKPHLCSPKTWAIYSIKGRVGNINKAEHSQKRTTKDKLVNGKRIFNADGTPIGLKPVVHGERFTVFEGEESISSLGIYPETVTPEDIVLAKEKLKEFQEFNNKRQRQGRHELRAPVGYTGYIAPPTYVADENETKKCKHCKKNKLLRSEFSRNSNDHRISYKNECKACVSILSAEYYKRTKLSKAKSNKKWRAANKDKVAASFKKWKEQNPIKKYLSDKKWRDANKERTRKYKKVK